MKTKTQHDLEVSEISHKLKTLFINHDLIEKKTISNTTRNTSESIRKTIGIDRLNSVLEINAEEKTALVEPSLPMDALADACSKMGFIIPVMPEFKGITVGGAINGAGIESSSYEFGQFNDSCISYEVLLGNGDVIEVNKINHPDLFFGLSGAYGTLGFITLVKISLKPFKPWVVLQYHRFESIEEALHCLKNLAKKETPPEFLEALIFDPKQITVIEGSLKSEEEALLIPDTLSLKWPNRWYYEHVKHTNCQKEKMATKSYLFRHDQGAFWMGAYASHVKFLMRYYLSNRLHLKWLADRLFSIPSLKKDFKLKSPGLLFRLMFNWWMSSRKLYRMLHARSEHWFENNFIIQDYYIPFDHTKKFIDHSIEKTGIFPIWLCPVKGTTTPQLFSPHYQKDINELFVDVGIYGFPKSPESPKTLTKSLDSFTKSCNGRKMLYSFNYYTEKEFFEIYDEDEYLKLRQKYHANHLPPIHKKIL